MKPLLLLPLLCMACVQHITPHNGHAKKINKELCEHYSGEVPYDAERARIIKQQVELYCE